MDSLEKSIINSAGAEHTCAVNKHSYADYGYLFCWGDGGSGRTTHVWQHDIAYPTQVWDANDVSSVSAGSYNTCLVAPTHVHLKAQLKCFGAPASLGKETGNSVNATPITVSLINKYSPSYSSGLSSSEYVKQVAVGNQSTCALTTNGRLWCWGSNNNGQLGDGGTSNRSIPYQTCSQ